MLLYTHKFFFPSELYITTAAVADHQVDKGKQKKCMHCYQICAIENLFDFFVSWLNQTCPFMFISVRVLLMASLPKCMHTECVC